jgi:hypothetical protein
MEKFIVPNWVILVAAALVGLLRVSVVAMLVFFRRAD